MINKYDLKIKKILNMLRIAHKQSELFSTTHPLGLRTPRISHDIYAMALAYENKKCLLLKLKLAYSEKYQLDYSSRDFLKKEIVIHEQCIVAWENRTFPHLYNAQQKYV